MDKLSNQSLHGRAASHRALTPRLITAPLLWALLGAGAPPLSFTTVEPRFAEAADSYRRIWQEDGAGIVAALERTAGLTFPTAPIEVIVNGGSTMTSLDGSTIRFRAGYSRDFAKATLAHELGHRLALRLPRTSEMDDHRVLYLFLYDTWTDLYGRNFADRMVEIERSFHTSAYDYDAAWRWALSMSRAQRQARLKWLRSGSRTQATG
jgi:hypothetical protein